MAMDDSAEEILEKELEEQAKLKEEQKTESLGKSIKNSRISEYLSKKQYMEVAVLQSLKDAGPSSRLGLMQLGITSKVINKLIKCGILVERRDALTGLPTYQVRDDFDPTARLE